VLLLLAGLPPGQAQRVRAAEYSMETSASYAVAPDERLVSVSVEVTFENTTPDPAGQFSLFEVVDLALQPGASEVSAADGEGELRVDMAHRDGFLLASVHPRQGVRYQEQATFSVDYELADGAAVDLRIRPSLVAFPVWSFGTGGSVEVTLPDRYDVTVDGNDLEAERAGGSVVLASGHIEDPQAWLAHLLAVGPSSYTTLAAAVPLGSATVDLQVRAWADDEAWGNATLDLLSKALPLLEERIGLAYPQVGPLVVIESVGGAGEGYDDGTDEGTQLQAGYDQPPFTLVHQAAHAWYADQLASDRWIREGFASLAAGELADELAIEPAYDPAARRAELDGSAFPLVSWGAGESTPDQDAWAYAAAWDVAAQIADLVGPEGVQLAWRRIANDVGPYDPVSGEPPAVGHPATPTTPADSRRLLDQLEAVSDADVAAVFATSIFDPDTTALLPARAEARAGLRELLDAADGWGAPEPVQVDLTAWRFDSAQQRISDARSWLTDRDALLAAAEETGLTVPQRLRDRYRTAGGGADAREELEAERAVVDRYREVLGRSNGERSILERLGLLGGPRPSALLSDANRLFAEGELRGAAEAVAAARMRLEHAATDGIVRIAAVLLVAVVLMFVAFRLVRRRRARPASDYTAAP
jgi:hypothetical protein